MPRATPPITAFNKGELSPRMYGRSDHKAYYAGQRVCQNFTGRPQGPVDRRGGTRFVAMAKHNDKAGGLIGFSYNAAQSYMIEAAEYAFRFFKDKAPIVAPNTIAAIVNGTFPVDLSSWTASSVTHATAAALFAAGGTLYQSCAVSPNVLHVLCFEVAGLTGRDTLTLRVGTGAGLADVLAAKECAVGWYCVEFTPAASPVFVHFTQSAGTPKVKAVRFLDDEPVELVHPFAETEVGPPPAIVNGNSRASLASVQSADVLFAVHPSHWPCDLSRTGHASWSLVPEDVIDGPYLPKNATATTLTPAATTGEAVVVVASAITGINDNRGFQAGDVGRCLRIGTKWCRIAEVTDTLNIKVHVRDTLAGSGAGVTDWTLGLWCDTYGWPRAITFHEERLVRGGAALRPQQINGSKVGDFYTFTPGTGDADPFAYNIGSNQVNTALWLASAGALLAGTPGGIAVYRGGALGKPITPTSVQAKFDTRLGANAVRALEADQIIYVHAQGRKIFGIDYNQSLDRYVPVELTLLADHITQGGVNRVAYQQEPFGVVWGRREDGQLIACTLLPEQEVTGWQRHPLGGVDVAVEDVAVIPGDGTDELWLRVRRTINGATVRTIEVLEPPLADDARQDEGFYVDCGLSLDNAIAATLTPGAGATVAGTAGVVFTAGAAVFAAGNVGQEIHHDFSVTADNDNGVPVTTLSKARAVITGFTDSTHVTATILIAFPTTAALASGDWRLTVSTVSGLSHLEGETVQCLADGAVVAEQVVSGGAITLPGPASRVHAGLGFVSLLETMPIEAGATEGSASTKPQRISELTLLFVRSLGGKAGRDIEHLDNIEYRTADDLMDEPEPLFTGAKKIDFPGDWERGATAVVLQRDPLPMSLAKAVPTVVTSG